MWLGPKSSVLHHPLFESCLKEPGICVRPTTSGSRTGHKKHFVAHTRLNTQRWWLVRGLGVLGTPLSDISEFTELTIEVQGQTLSARLTIMEYRPFEMAVRLSIREASMNTIREGRHSPTSFTSPYKSCTP